MRRVCCCKALAGICCALLRVLNAFADALDNWQTVSPSPQANTLYNVIYTNGLFLVCGANGAITVSTNGIKWTNYNAGTVSTLRGVAFGNQTYVAVGYDPSSRKILTSTNITKWKSRTAAP